MEDTLQMFYMYLHNIAYFNNLIFRARMNQLQACQRLWIPSTTIRIEIVDLFSAFCSTSVQECKIPHCAFGITESGYIKFLQILLVRIYKHNGLYSWRCTKYIPRLNQTSLGLRVLGYVLNSPGTKRSLQVQNYDFSLALVQDYLPLRIQANRFSLNFFTV